MYWTYADPFTSSFHQGSFIITVILLAIECYPVIYWLWNGWTWKENDILVSLTTDAKDEYLHAFQRQPKDIGTAESRFTSFYKEWYGRRNYVVPFSCLIVVSLYLSWSLSETALYYLSLEQGPGAAGDYIHLPLIAASAYAGAYIFVASDLINRAARRDITADDVMNSALRLAGCVPLGYAFSQLLTPAIGPFVAFAVGAFPLSVLATVLKRIANKRLNLDIGADTAPDQVIKLSGVDANISDRIAEVDITTATQLAYCDPIQLAMRSNLGFYYVIDIVSQALAWVYFENLLERIRPLGLRGAFEIWNFIRNLDSPDAAAKQKAEDLLLLMAKSVGLEPPALLNAFVEIAADPRTSFLIKAYS